VIHIIVYVADTAELLSAPAYGAGALLRWESAPTIDGTFTEGATIPLVAGISAYDIWDAAGVEGMWYRTRISNAAATTFSPYKGPVPASGPVVSLDEARGRGIPLPADDAAAQSIISEWEAWLARRIGPLDGNRTETFWVQYTSTRQKLSLRRYTSAVAVIDGGMTLGATDFMLTDNGSTLSRVDSLGSTLFWSGPFVTATYSPNDLDEVRRVLFALLVLAVDEHADGPYVSENLGDYGYSKGSSAVATDAVRAVLADGLLPKRDPALSILASSRRVSFDDPVINRREPVW
jgi:hypothetical protein